MTANKEQMVRCEPGGELVNGCFQILGSADAGHQPLGASGDPWARGSGCLTGCFTGSLGPGDWRPEAAGRQRTQGSSGRPSQESPPREEVWIVRFSHLAPVYQKAAPKKSGPVLLDHRSGAQYGGFKDLVRSPPRRRSHGYGWESPLS